MGSAEAMPVDLGRLAEQADAERDRLLGPAGRGVRPGRPRAVRPWRWPGNWSATIRTRTA